MAIDPRKYIKVDKRFPESLAGDQGKALVVNQDASGYEHSAQVTITDITGQIIMWPTDTPPTGYLLCDGSTYAYNDYPALGAILGAGPGQQFQVPNINFAKNSKGVGTLTEEAEEVGPHNHPSDNAGGHSHSLTINSAGSHGHGVNSGGSHSHSVGSVGDHDHSYVRPVSGTRRAQDGTKSMVGDSSSRTGGAGGHSHSLGSAGSHGHTLNSAGSHTHTGSSGAVADHNHNIQPNSGTKNQPACTLINFLIKT